MTDVEFIEPDRARRIRHRERLIARYRRRFADGWWYDGPESRRRDRDTGELVVGGTWRDLHGRSRSGPTTWEEVHEARAARARRTLDTPTPCSCFACGNPRKWHRAASPQEMRADADASHQMEEAGLRHFPRFGDGW